MHYSNCSVLSITYQNEETGYSVVNLHNDDCLQPITCVGVMPSIYKGESVSVEGYWETHKRYGKRFVVQKYHICRPATTEGIVSFLTSGILSNIGPVKAGRIVERFGKDTIDVIEKDPQKLREVSGIGGKTVEAIIKKWRENEGLREVMVFLKEYGVSLSTANRIYKKYGGEAREKISKNPYVLCEDIYGIGFVKADRIAEKMGFSHDSYRRIRAGLLHVMGESLQEGHSCVPSPFLGDHAAGMLGVSEEKIRFSLDHLLNVGLLVDDGDMIYLPELHRSETMVASYIAGIVGSRQECNQNVDIDKWLSTYEQQSGWQSEPVQEKAIRTMLDCRCMILTGGPGTGKTTVLKVIVALFEQMNKRIFLAAPTGRAAQRIKETTGKDAYTIHRLLEYSPQASLNKNRFAKNESNQLEADVVIIDEFSMMDIQLMYHLCCALKMETRLLLVGDSNQLPSVGAGNVLADMLVGNCVPSVQLETVFRQEQRSYIIGAAHEINNGIVPFFPNKKDNDCFFIEQSDPDKVLEIIVDLVTRRLPESYNLNPVHDIQVLSPMHKGVLGTENINMILQGRVNNKEKALKSKSTIFYLGDKVLQTKNNYEQNVFNGDIGFIIKIIDDCGLIVDFSGNMVTYTTEMLDELIPAYCISIHKSQGSEFTTIVLPLVTQHFMMLQRNLVYTALTRAKRLCVFVGSRRALKIAVETNKSAVRFSRLAERITAEIGRNREQDLFLEKK